MSKLKPILMLSSALLLPSIANAETLQTFFYLNHLQGKIASLHTAIATEKSTLANCPQWYFTRCILPQRDKIAVLESELDSLNTHLAKFSGGAK